MRKVLLSFLMLAAMLGDRLAVDCQGQPSVRVAWSPVTNPYVAGYYLAYGTNGLNFEFTNVYPANQTNGCISNLSFGLIYTIAVAAFATNGEQYPIGPWS